ncbi:MAG TPA: N-acetyl-alpha-D-glucosaminyl L-malate synthase BshA [Cerasibacillus sp.]|uniref:N-acetyl-alpha-D-glucosaminyl L-malate synthase BshA n=1 Tax=Cerasibacillus sp. TaxID=2498711 RepID=UPI002F3EECC8
MKIGMTCYPTVGGSGVIATELGMLLAKRGHEIHFITSGLPFRLNQVNPFIYYHEVEVNQYPVFQYAPYDLALASKMAEVIDQHELDILHVHYAIPHAISAILARDIAKRDVKIVTTLHGTDITVLGVDQLFKKMIAYAIEKSDAVTAVSNSLKEQTIELTHVNKEIDVIYNFINEKVYYKKELPYLKSQYGIEDDEKVLIHISNFRKVKRIEDIIQTFYHVQKRVKAKLLLVGDGPDCTNAYQLVEKLNLENNVLFLGKQKNISDLLSISDLHLLLSEKESFGLVILEAMACQVPTIGSRVGGIPEVIKHNETGFLVEVGQVEEAAKRAIELLTNTEKLARFSQQAYNHAQEHFHSDMIVKQYVNLYKSLLNR